MVMYVRTGGAWAPKSSLAVKQAGSMVTKTSAFKRAGGAWVQFLTAMVALSSRTVSDAGSGHTVIVGLELATSGAAIQRRSESGDAAISGEWRIAGSSSDYEAQWVPISGTPEAGQSPVNTWIDLGVGSGSGTTLWTKAAPSVGTFSCQGQVQIRQKSTGAVLVSAVITLSATRSS